MTAWKNTERKIAKRLGGERVPITGRQRGDVPDVKHDIYSLEIKHRKELPKWIHDAMNQAKAAVRGAQVPVVVLHEAGRRHDDDYVIFRLSDVCDCDPEQFLARLREIGGI